MNRLWQPLIAILFFISVATAQVTGPDNGANTACGVSGVNSSGTCLNNTGSSGVSTGVPGGTVVNTMAIDGAVNGNANTFTKALPGLTTATANDVIIVMFECNVNCNGNQSVTSTHLTFTQRAWNGSGGNALWEFCAIASGTLSSEVITVSGLNGTTTFVEGTAFGISGAHNAACPGPFDTNGALPYQATSGNATITTSNAADMLLAAFRTGSTCAATGFTQVGTGSFLCVLRKNVTTTQPSLTVTDPGSNNGLIGDAVIQGP
jgi:hypothetical protein